jgi:hypothetical protein
MERKEGILEWQLRVSIINQQRSARGNKNVSNNDDDIDFY